MRASRGFTLIEVMIAVAVIAILTAIAFPSYQAHTRKAARAAAQAAMMQIADRQAQYLLDARSYAAGSTALTDLSFTTPTEVQGKYNIQITADTTAGAPPNYTITATPVSGTNQEQDGVLTLTNTGVKTRAGNVGW